MQSQQKFQWARFEKYTWLPLYEKSYANDFIHSFIVFS